MTLEDMVREIVRQEIAECGLVAKHLPRTREEEIIHEVAYAHGVAPEDMRGPVRTRTLHAARLDAYTQLHDMGRSWNEVARLFNRDHTTIMAAMKGK